MCVGGQADPFGTDALFDDDNEPAMVMRACNARAHTHTHAHIHNTRTASMRTHVLIQTHTHTHTQIEREHDTVTYLLLPPAARSPPPRTGGDAGQRAQSRIHTQYGRARGRCCCCRMGYAGMPHTHTHTHTHTYMCVKERARARARARARECVCVRSLLFLSRSLSRALSLSGSFLVTCDMYVSSFLFLLDRSISIPSFDTCGWNLQHGVDTEPAFDRDGTADPDLGAGKDNYNA